MAETHAGLRTAAAREKHREAAGDVAVVHRKEAIATAAAAVACERHDVTRSSDSALERCHDAECR